MARLSRILLLAAVAGWGAARATDLPHAASASFSSDTCGSCHVPHGASGTALTVNASNANLCLNCHTAKGGVGVSTWSSTDQAVVGTSGSSHSWSGNATNAPYGATPPTDPTMAARLAGGTSLECSTCHDQHTQKRNPADPDAPAYPANAAVTLAKRHFQRSDDSSDGMCVSCHAAWNQSTAAEETPNAGSARSHPVLAKATGTPLVMNAAGSGAADPTYKQVPHDFPIRLTAFSASTAGSVTVDGARYPYVTGALTGLVLRFTRGAFQNVPVVITGNTYTGGATPTNAISFAALPAAPASGASSDMAEIDRAAYAYYTNAYDTATGGSATTLVDSSKNWPTSGNASPYAGGGSVTILATTPAGGNGSGTSDAGSVCSITAANTATTLTIGSCKPALQNTPGAGWMYAVSWKLSASSTTTAAGTTTTFVDNTRLWPANGIVGLQVRFLQSNSTATVTAWNATTYTATFSPARSTAVTSGEPYQLEPAQVGPYLGTVAATPAPTTTTLGTQEASPFPATANALQNLMVRFTSGVNQGLVTRATASTSSTLGFVALPAAPAAGDTFEVDLDGNTSNNVWLAGTPPTFDAPASGIVACTSCHGPHYADSDPSTYDDRPRPGDGRLLRRGYQNGATDELCEGCHATKIHNSITTQSKYGTWGTSFTCLTCHQPHNTSNIFLVKPQITRPSDGTAIAVNFQDNASGQNPNALVNASSNTVQQTSGNGPCEACHLNTRNGQLYGPSVGALGSGNATVSGTTVTCSGTCNFSTLVTAAGWEFRIAGDPDTSWTRVSSATATTMTLAVAYPRNVTAAAGYQIANPRYRSATAQRQSLGSGRGVNPGDHYTTQCTACHQHSLGFKAGESKGGVQCDGCHGTIYQAMNGTVAKTTKHTLGTVPSTNATYVDSSSIAWSATAYTAGTATFTNGSTAVTGSGTSWTSSMVSGVVKNNATGIWYRIAAVPGATSITLAAAYAQPTAGGAAYTISSALGQNAPAQRSCVDMCHGDHPHDLPGTSTTHEYNAYLDASTYASRADNGGALTQTRTTATRDNTDFDNAQANGGMCVSCHRSPVDERHYEIGQAAFAASAHNYTSFGTYGAWTYTLHDGGVFNRNCTKCHADPGDTQADSSFPFGAVHFSSNASLLSGTTNPAGAPASFVCYGCHGNGTTGKNLSGKDIATQIAKAYDHPVNADATHSSVNEFAGSTWGAGLGAGVARHANCIDCHDEHSAQATSTSVRVTGSATNGNVAGAGITGAWGAQLSSSPGFAAATSSGSFTKKTVAAGTDLEATLCFKCHSSYSWGTGVSPVSPSGVVYNTGTATAAAGGTTVTGSGTTWTSSYVSWLVKNNALGVWHVITARASNTSITISPAATAAWAGAYTIQAPETDVARELNPNNVGNGGAGYGGGATWASGKDAGSFHPVLATANGSLGLTANILAPFSKTSLMVCTDCHESDTTTDPGGPHGSAAKFILKGPNTTWGPGISLTNSGMPAGTFCANCHAANFANTRFVDSRTGNTGTNMHLSQHPNQTTCTTCHALIPHGTARPGLLSAGMGANSALNGGATYWSDGPPYAATDNRLGLAAYPTSQNVDWSQSYCGCGNNQAGH